MSVENTFNPIQPEIQKYSSVAPIDIVPPIGDDIQFSAQHGVVRVDGAKVHYTITTSDVCAPLGEAAMTLITPGIYGVECGYLPFAKEVARQGQTAITFKPPRHQGLKSILPHNICHPQELLPSSADAISLDVMKKFGTGQYHYIGHSMGGPAAATATDKAMQRDSGPEILSTTLLNSAGFNGHHLVPLSMRVPRLIPEIMQLAAKYPLMTAHAAAYGAINPWRTFGEAFTVSECAISRDQLQRIRNAGTKVIALFNRHDQLFPGDRVEQFTQGSVDHFEYAEPEKGGHLSPQLYPELVAPQWGRAITKVMGLNRPDLSIVR